MLTNMYDVLRSPKSAFQRIVKEENLWKSLDVQVIVFFINGLVNKSGTDSPLWLSCVSALIASLVAVVICAISAGLTHGIARLMGGCGTWKKQFITLGYSVLPQLIFVPLQVIALWMDMTEAVTILAIIASVWCIVLGVRAISITQQISTIKAVVVLFAPSIIVGVIGAAIVLSTLGI